MRCKKHPADPSSSVGVCAPCLRERLFALVAAQARAQPQPPPPPPLTFPRSVSPYVSRRKSDDPREHRFYSTPQVGPGAAPGCLPPTKKKNRRLAAIFHLFRSRSEKFDTDSDPRVLASPLRDSSRTSSSSPSWFLFVPGRRRGPSRLSSVGNTITADDKNSALVSDRGMSPAREADPDEDLDDRSPSGSGCSSESSQGWKKTPAAGVTPASAAAGRRTRAPYPRKMSGLAFCLSPLMRPSPGRGWKQQKGSSLHQETGFSGEIRASPRPHISTAASSCANRSRKLADFGRRMKHNR